MKYPAMSLTGNTDFAKLLLGAMSGKDGEVDFARTYFPDGVKADSEVDVKVSVNGVDIDPKLFIELLMEQYNALCQERAQEILEGTAKDLQDKLFRLEEAVKSHMQGIFRSMPDQEWQNPYPASQKAE